MPPTTPNYRVPGKRKIIKTVPYVAERKMEEEHEMDFV